MVKRLWRKVSSPLLVKLARRQIARRAEGHDEKGEPKPSSPKGAKPRTYRPIHLATLVLLTTVALAATTVAAWFMWDAARVPAKLITSPDLAVRTAQLRVDVIRNILAVGAGTGGLIALFLALRRQYVKERVDYDDQAHKNRTAEDTRHDAGERRVTDLYVKAAEQLGSEKAAVRLAALYALERLGQGNPEHRQTIVSLICAYLRMPFLAPESSGEVYYAEQLRQQDREVRATALRILASHLRYEEIINDMDSRFAVGGDKFWPGMEVNLAGALLEEAPLYLCAVESLWLERAVVTGHASFSRLFATGPVSISGCKFERAADFGYSKSFMFFAENAQFSYDASFVAAEFRSGDFGGATFRGLATFAQVQADHVELRGARATFAYADTHTWPAGYELIGDGGDDDMGELRWTKATRPERRRHPSQVVRQPRHDL